MVQATVRICPILLKICWSLSLRPFAPPKPTAHGTGTTADGTTTGSTTTPRPRDAARIGRGVADLEGNGEDAHSDSRMEAARTVWNGRKMY